MVWQQTRRPTRPHKSAAGLPCRADCPQVKAGERRVGANQFQGRNGPQTHWVATGDVWSDEALGANKEKQDLEAVPRPCQGLVLWRRRPERATGVLGKSACWSRTFARSDGSG